MRINSVPDVKCFFNNKNVLVHNKWYDISCATLYYKIKTISYIRCKCSISKVGVVMD